MTTAKQSWFKRSLSVLMVIAMAASAFTANAFSVKAKAESYPEGSREVRRLEAPVEDGVYTASIELMNANSTELHLWVMQRCEAAVPFCRKTRMTRNISLLS